MTFEQFMEMALYAPETGYYRRVRDPFGKLGDFYTASQLQPTFSILAGQIVTTLLERAGAGTVVELGPGRREMAPAFARHNYVPVDITDQMPEQFSGVVFANEFFDALPVHLVRRQRGAWREVCVNAREGRYTFAPRTARPTSEVLEYLERYHPGAPANSVVEVNLRAALHVAAVSRAITRGYWIIIDYGYTAPEWIRHSHGTLMSYRRHLAEDDVLSDPGDRDITAHVAWTPLMDALEANGWRIESFRTLARTLLDAGERDQFASVIEGCDEAEQMRRRMQLKSLLFGMGETFRVLTASRNIER